MRVSPIGRLAAKGRRLTLAAAALAALSASPALADSAYVAQVPGTPVKDLSFNPIGQGGSNNAPAWHSSRQQNFTPPPEATTAASQNLAQSFQIGSYNSTYHFQSGVNNSSTVGIIGAENNVAVLQSGNNLKSNVVLLNTAGLNVGVLQPNGSAPVNVLIARLPGGGLLIKR
jgi:hypothetical protein